MLFHSVIENVNVTLLCPQCCKLPVLKSAVFIWGGGGGWGGGTRPPLSEFLDPPLNFDR